MVKTILITRPKAAARAFARQIDQRFPGAFEAVIAPLTEIRAVEARLDLGGVAALIFTSANAVQQFADRDDAAKLPAYCAGQATATAARQAGMAVLATGGSLAELERVIIADAPHGRLLHLRGVHVAGDLVGNLRTKGLHIDSLVIYDQATLPMPQAVKTQLAQGRIDIATFFSPRAAGLFCRSGAEQRLQNSTAVCISANTATQLRDAGFGAVTIAAGPTLEAILAELARLV